MGLFTCLTVVWMGVLLGQTRMRHNPRIMMNPVTPVSWVFFGVYALLCLLPVGLEVWTEYRFHWAREECCCKRQWTEKGGSMKKGSCGGPALCSWPWQSQPYRLWEIYAGYHQADQVYPGYGGASYPHRVSWGS